MCLYRVACVLNAYIVKFDRVYYDSSFPFTVCCKLALLYIFHPSKYTVRYYNIRTEKLVKFCRLHVRILRRLGAWCDEYFKLLDQDC